MSHCSPWRALTAAVLLAAAPARAATATNWPRWRGPQDNGAAAPGVYPVIWSATTNVLWKVPLPGRGCSTPIVWDRRIYLTAPVAGQDALLAFDDAGQALWQREIASAFVPTPAAAQGRLYLLGDRGDLAGVDALTGRSLWQGRLPENSNHYYASPVLAGGNLYAAREDGVVYVVRADDTCALLAENTLGERLIASPVPVANRLLLRGEKNLYCIGAR